MIVKSCFYQHYVEEYVKSERGILPVPNVERMILLGWMPPQADDKCHWQRNIQVNYSNWSTSTSQLTFSWLADPTLTHTLLLLYGYRIKSSKCPWDALSFFAYGRKSTKVFHWLIFYRLLNDDKHTQLASRANCCWLKWLTRSMQKTLIPVNLYW